MSVRGLEHGQAVSSVQQRQCEQGDWKFESMMSLDSFYKSVCQSTGVPWKVHWYMHTTLTQNKFQVQSFFSLVLGTCMYVCMYVMYTTRVQFF